MSDIRFEGWLHRSGTGGVYQDSAGNVGIASTQPKTRLDIQNGAFQIGPAGICTATTVNTTNIINATPLSHRNKVINGAMLVAQRGTSHSPGASDQVYTLDRFQHVATTGVSFDATVTQDSSVPDGFSKSYKVTPDATNTPTGGGNGVVRQIIEGQNAQDFAYGTSSAKQVTVSFYAKSSSTNNGDQYTFQLRHFATDATKRSINAPFTITSSFQRFTFTFDGDTAVDVIDSIAAGVELDWILAAGPDDIASQHTSWTTTNLFTAVTGQDNFIDNTSNEFYLTGVQLEIGSVATPFEHRTIGEELTRCQRYYYTTRGGSVGNPNSDSAGFFGVPLNSSGSGFGIATFPVPMRVVPTVVLYDGTAASGQFTQNGNNYFAGTAGGINQNGFNLVSRSSGTLSDDANMTLTAGFTANGEI